MLGLLHDVVEDTEYTLDDIESNFGSEVALLVDGVTKLGKLEYKPRRSSRPKTFARCFCHG